MTPAELRALLAKADWSDPTHPATERLTDALPALLDVVEAAKIVDDNHIDRHDPSQCRTCAMKTALAKLGSK